MGRSVGGFVLLLTGTLSAQMVVTGRLSAPRYPGSADQVPLTAVLSFASLDGPGSQALGFRTWEMEPAGWFRFAGSAGNYTLVFSTPAYYMRPLVMTNVYTRDGETLDRRLTHDADLAVFDDSAWDTKPARVYYQPFVAKGRSVTQVGFKLATDGVDGAGPGSQTMLLSIHRRGPGTPDTWEQVGPTMPVLAVDCGGPKSYAYSAGWNSGEVPTLPGKTYAVRLRAESGPGRLQAFWRAADAQKMPCYRMAEDGAGFVDKTLWMAVSTDGDNLLIPYNKRVHRQFHELTRMASKWSQIYVAQGRSLASVIVYAATSGIQPSINRQRVAVRVRKGGPKGPCVGVEKIAIGNGMFTGDASWGTFGLAYAPGEVMLEPGETYAIEFESIENFETLHGYVNIKGMASDDRPGLNPYRKCPPDDYPAGTAYVHGTERMDFDLDMQVIEYAHAAEDWSHAVETKSFLANGDMQSGTIVADDPAAGRADAWTAFAIDPATTYHYLTDPAGGDNRFLRVVGGGLNAKTVDGGYAQRVGGLDCLETYRLTGRLRASWPVDADHQCFIGHDPTGQMDDPKAATIVWKMFPAVHGVFVDYRSDPIRPATDAISIWLRGRTTLTVDWPFRADFDDFAVQRVRTDVPDGK